MLTCLVKRYVCSIFNMYILVHNLYIGTNSTINYYYCAILRFKLNYNLKTWHYNNTFGFDLNCFDKTKYGKSRQQNIMVLDITLQKHKTVNGLGVHCPIQYARRKPDAS